MSDQQEDQEFVARMGPLEIDWPRSIGYFGGIGLAVAFELIAPELVLFVAAVPLLKALKRRHAPLIERLIGAVLEGSAKPVGGDTEGVVRLANQDEDESRDARASAPGAAPGPLEKSAPTAS
jgi:hypothetical protein